MAPKIFQAFLCIYEACDPDPDGCLPGCKSKSEFICINREFCCALDEPPVGIGLVTNPDNKELCKIGCHCCAYGIKQPETFCKGATQICCMRVVGALPTGDAEYLKDDIVCSMYCFTCSPEVGCCVDAPSCPALDRPVSDYSVVATSAPGMARMEREGLEMNKNNMSSSSYSDQPPKGFCQSQYQFSRSLISCKRNQ